MIMRNYKVNEMVRLECKNQHPMKERGFVMIEEVESHLHYSHRRSLVEFLIQKILRRDLMGNQFNVSIFVASGRDIDEKIDKLNRRIHKK